MGNIPFIFNFFENSACRKQIVHGFSLSRAVFKQYQSTVLKGMSSRIYGSL